MHSILWSVTLLAASVVAAPSYTPQPGDLDALSQYFGLLAVQVRDARSSSPGPPLCDLSQAQLPASTLPPPTGLTLKHVALGRGTQNYTCANPGDANTKPASFGAKASLYNASCVASTQPSLMVKIPAFALQFNLASFDNPSAPTPANLDVSGHHYFPDGKTPYFDLDTTGMNGMTLGQALCAKNASANAPTDAVAGQGGSGNGAVPWLQLLTKAGSSGGLVSVYRVNTAGGNPPANCSGMPAAFTVEYAAEYWFYTS